MFSKIICEIKKVKKIVYLAMFFKVRLHTAINRAADFVSWCMLYTYEGNKMHS